MFEFYLPLMAILLALILTIFLLLRHRTSLAIYALSGALLACACSEIFDLLAVANPASWLLMKRWTLIAESWQPFFFLLFGLTFARDQAIRGLTWLSRILLAGSLVLPIFAAASPAVKWFYSPDFIEEKVLFLHNYGFYFYISLMGYLATALFHLERTLVALPKFDREQVKLEMVGTGAIMMILVIYYSQALLYRSIDMNLVPVRSLILIIGVTMIGVSRLRNGVVAKVRVSRVMAYRSLVLLAVGAYLAGLGMLGEGMRYLDLAMQRTLFVSIAVLAGLAILLVLLSEKLRRRAKVFLHKHFYQNKYDYRREWRRFTDHLSSARSIEALQQGILSFYCDTFACQNAALYQRDNEFDNYRLTAEYQIDDLAEVFEDEGPFAAFLTDRDWIFNTADENPDELKGVLQFCHTYGFTLAVPLLFEKRLEGVIFLGHAIYPEEHLKYEDFDLMKVLARQATSTLLSLKLSVQLSSAREMAAIGKVSTFVVHDLKNLVSNLAMMTENAREYLDDPDFQRDMLETLEGTTTRMKAMISRLKNVTERKNLNLEPSDLLNAAVSGIRLVGEGQVSLQGEPVAALLDQREMEKVIHNLILNAQEAGGAPVRIEVGRDREAFLRVTDQGCGMTEEFIRQRLFQPFQTTKPNGFGIGLYQCKNIIEAHGGRIEVESRVGEGTSFTVFLPGQGGI